MKKNIFLDVSGAHLNIDQLEIYMEKLAASQILKNSSNKETYPIPRAKENLKFIEIVYNILNEDLKNNIPIHPAGEWILDNFYIIEKTFKYISKELTLKKYKNLIGIASGKYMGFARIYVIANEIVSYTDGKIEADLLERYLKAYQNKKTLSMQELWCINIFIQISLLEKIRGISEKVLLTQFQKRKVENLIFRLVDNDNNTKNSVMYEASRDSINKYLKNINMANDVEIRNTFVEYLSFKLRKYGKKSYEYLEILENQTQKMGCSITECINKEHFDIAVKKLSMGNSIISINNLNRLNFTEIFNRINGVEEVLNSDPAQIYSKMDYKTKEYYRAKIEQISKKTKISEIYIARICIKLANMKSDEKQRHVGYYLISKGISELYDNLLGKNNGFKKIKSITKLKLYIYFVSILSVIISGFIACNFNNKGNSFLFSLLLFFILIIPIKTIIINIVQYISGKIVEQKIIPKMDFSEGIPDKFRSMVVIPTIIKDAEKVKALFHKLEVYYLANKSENLYFSILGDCSESKKQNEEFDEYIIKEAIKQCQKLNEKYKDDNFPKFNFVYRKRIYCKGEKCFLGWERKRGLLAQFNDFLISDYQNDQFLYNSISGYFKENKLVPNFKFKYIITLDSDTSLSLGSGLELVGAMAHVLNEPVLNSEKSRVISGYGIMQPRVGINLEEAEKSLFCELFSGIPGTDSYTNAISDFYFDNFDEGIFTGKGIYDLEVFSSVMKNQIPENTVLSHDLIEGCYARCGLATDILVMDGFPSKYNAYKLRSHRWIRGDFQIIRWFFNNKLNLLSKYKILDNLVRALNSVFVLLVIGYGAYFNNYLLLVLGLISVGISYLIDIINKIVFKKNGESKKKSFTLKVNSFKTYFIKFFIEMSLISDKAYTSFNAIVKSIYRMIISKKHLLQWTTAEQAEKNGRNKLYNYIFNMLFSVLLGFAFTILGIKNNNFITLLLGVLGVLSPVIMWKVSKTRSKKNKLCYLQKNEQEYFIEIAKKTWNYFKDNINEKGNYLPPDNYQEDRKEQIVYRTSPTNIGLGFLSVVSAYDMGFESLEETISLLNKMIDTLSILPKWNGHLFNWYDIKKLEPLTPRYVSSVDSGNFVRLFICFKTVFD